MNKPSLFIFGLGAAGADDVSLGALRRLKELSVQGCPLFLRTERHPCVPALSAEGVVFTSSFDDVYDKADTFEDVYSTIAASVIASVTTSGCAGYLVPGHPMVGEQTVHLLLQHQDRIDISIIPGSSFIEVCLASAKQEVSGLVVLNAMSLPDVNDLYHKYSSPFNQTLPHLIYQVYDGQIASKVKLTLLDVYPPDTEIIILSQAGLSGAEKLTRTALHRLDHAENSFDHLTTVLVPALKTPSSTSEFTTLLDIMAQLRHPVTGCPWDKEQTPETLKRFAIEEVYEVIDAIDEGDVDKYIEELGDLLLQVAFHAQLAREAGEFSIEDVISGISEKLIRRHPHVFGDVLVSGSEDVLVNWEAIKRTETGNLSRKSRLDGVPRHLPALAQAQEISKRAAKCGFEWPSIEGVFEKLDEELIELKEALAEGDHSHILGELGDLLFTVVNISRFAKIDAEDALRIMVKRFTTRFKTMETLAAQPLEELNGNELESLWQTAKREELKGN